MGKQGCGLVAARAPVLALSVLLVPLLALCTPNGEGECPQPRLWYLDVALQTDAVLSRVDPDQRFVDALERFRLALQERQLDTILDRSVGCLDIVTNFGGPADAPLPLATLHVLADLAPAFCEQLAKFHSSHFCHRSASCDKQHARSLTPRLCTWEHSHFQGSGGADP
jgi:hypothetical protein